MSLLNKVVTGIKKKPICLLVYGVHGIGKSSFPLQMPNPIFIGPEENDELEVARFPKVSKWNDLLGQLKTLRDEKHDYKTLVIDTIDTLEHMAEIEILKGLPKKVTMATVMGGYGSGYRAMAKMFLEIREEYLIPIRDNVGMNIILLAHSSMEKIEDPVSMTSYDTYYPNMDKRVRPIIEDWVSGILFINYVLFKTEAANGKEFAVGEGERRIYTEERPSHQAKNRFGLPYEMRYTLQVGCREVIDCINKFYGESDKFIAPVKAAIDELRDIYPSLSPQAQEYIKRSMQTDLSEDQRKQLLHNVKNNINL